MAAAPIYNPIVPCIHQIPGGFYPGKMLRVQGNIPPNAQRFAINLQCGPSTDPRDDIALHLNFRFVERCIVRNNLSSMNWGPEEIDGGIPLNPGQGFETLILCEHNSIKVAINGNHFCEFIHRLPYQRITHMTVDGDVALQMIGFEGSQVGGPQSGYVPSSAPPAYGAPPPAYGAAGYGAPTGMPMESYGQPMSYGGQPQRTGMSAGAAGALGAVGGLAAGGLAGYALAGGFSSDDAPSESVHISEPEPEPVEDFGGDDWAD